MCETLISVALSDGGCGGGPSGMSWSWTEVPRGALAVRPVALGVPDVFTPGPGGGSLARLHAADASKHESSKKVRADGMREVLAKREAGVNSRAFLEGLLARTDNLPRPFGKSPSRRGNDGRL